MERKGNITQLRFTVGGFSVGLGVDGGRTRLSRVLDSVTPILDSDLTALASLNVCNLTSTSNPLGFGAPLSHGHTGSTLG